MEKLSGQLLDYGIATLTSEGECQSGDQYLVQPFMDGVLVAVVDGLGHGAEAAHAAGIAVHTLREHAGESVIALIRRCHLTLQHTRGAVMSLASVSGGDSNMTWIGIGNVGGVLIRADDSGQRGREILLMRSGVVGGALPALHASVIPVSQGDTLILATDGVVDGFYNEIPTSEPPQRIADRVLGTYSKGTDDAMVLVAHFLEKMG